MRKNWQHKLRLKYSKGSALLMSLLITAVCAVLATAIMVNQGAMIRQAALIHNSDQLYLALQGVQDWGLNMVVDNARFTPPAQLYSAADPSAFPENSVAGVSLRGFLTDEQTKFNINSLTDSGNADAFANLIRLVAPTIPQQAALNIATAVSNWLVPYGRQDSYLNATPASRPAGTLMVSISELKSVRLLYQQTPAVPDALWQALAPYITALPNRANWLNVNHLNNIAQATILLTAEEPNLPPAMAASLAGCLVQAKPFASREMLIQRCPAAVQISNVVFNSQYYQVVGFGSLDNQHMQLTSLIGIEHTDKQQPYFHVIWQTMS